MKAIYKRELGSYYNTMYGYVIDAVLLLFAGIFIWLFNINGGYNKLQYVLNYLCIVLLLAVPVLTMRIFAEERRQKTDVLLYSLPLTSGQIVLGKFFAALTVLLVPVVLIACYPLLLSAYGAVDMKTAYSGIIALIFLMAALVSIGTFISSLTENQAVAAGITVAAMLLLFYLNTFASYVSSTAAASLAAFIASSVVLGVIVWLVTKNVTFGGLAAVLLSAASIVSYFVMGEDFAGLFPSVMEELSIFERYFTFLDGIFSINGLVYLSSVTAVFLLLTAQSLEKRRWS